MPKQCVSFILKYNILFRNSILREAKIKYCEKEMTKIWHIRQSFAVWLDWGNNARGPACASKADILGSTEGKKCSFKGNWFLIDDCRLQTQASEIAASKKWTRRFFGYSRWRRDWKRTGRRYTARQWSVLLLQFPRNIYKLSFGLCAMESV